MNQKYSPKTNVFLTPKTCISCNQEKDIKYFNKRGSGFSSYCKPCNKEYCKLKYQQSLGQSQVIPLEKVCSACHIRFPASSFSFRLGSIDGLRSNCKTCCNKSCRDAHKRNKTKAKTYPLLKKCYVCGEDKLSSEFSKNHGNHDGLASECKTCEREKDEKRRIRCRMAAFTSLQPIRCKECGLAEFEFMTLQHKLGGGGKHTRELGSERVYLEVAQDPERAEKYEILCANCNMADGIRRLYLARNSIEKNYRSKHREKLKFEAMNWISNGVFSCNCCEIKYDIQKLCVDHIIPHSVDPEGPKSGTELYRWILAVRESSTEKLRRKQKFQILCHNCNKSKGTGPFCIHQRPL